jgi:hypothetical protein
MRRLPATSEDLRRLLQDEHGGAAAPLYIVPVRHVTGDLLWEGDVHVFSLLGNPEATQAYAWTCPFDGATHAVLRSGTIGSAGDAVRAVLQASGWGPNVSPDPGAPHL